MPEPIRVGVWCDYGVTLTPTEGIGVFVYNLMAGLLELDEPIEVIMLVRPGDQHVAANLQSRYPGRFHVVPEVWPVLPYFPRLTSIVQIGMRLIGRIGLKVHYLKRRIDRIRTQIQAGTIPAPWAWILRWSLEFFSGLGRMSIPLFRILHLLDGIEPCRHIRQKFSLLIDPQALRKQTACDVWLIPAVRYFYPLTFPSVLVIHDLVYIHYPNAMSDDDRAELEELAPSRAAEATLCACMSSFIRDTDLLGVLQLDPAKVRLIRPAAPADFPQISPEEAARLKPTRLTRPYLFYPAAFRSYKNHGALVEALHILRDRHGEDRFDLVFTGIHPLPKNLARQIKASGLQDRVHVLGCVDRPALAALYRCAFGTIVPSLYEQGSFPIYEALHWGCPVACSDIPSLREQCRPMGDAMIYFDPLDAEDIARTILTIRDNRETILDRQQSAGKALWQRTWTNAAHDWLAVFREAVDLSSKAACPSGYRPSSNPLRRSA